METLLELLREFGADDALITLADRFAQRENEGAEPLTDEELDQLQAGLVALAEDDEASAGLLSEAAGAVEAVRGEVTAREETAAQEDADRDAAIARLRGDDPEPDDEGDEGDTGGGEDDEAVDVEVSEDGETTVTESEEPEPVAASARRPAARRAMSRRRPRDAEPTEGNDGLSITFAPDVPGVAAGATAGTMADVDRGIGRRLDSFARSSTMRGSENIPVATIHRDIPEGRRLVDSAGRLLSSDDAAERVNAVIAAALAAARGNGGAMVAAGGLCAPLTPIYTQETLGEQSRPIRDTALVSFMANRGGVVSIAPPRLSQVTGAVSVWTVADDESATDGEPTKPTLRIDCGAQRTTEIEAYTKSLTWGNFLGRTFAELTAAWSDLTLVQHDRFAEQRLWTRIKALSTAVTAETTVVSATRDLLEVLSRTAWGMRSRHRLGRTYPFRVVLPEVLHGIMQEDIARGLPGGSFQENLTVAEAQMAQWFTTRRLNVTWSPDIQVIGAQAAGALADWPPTVEFGVYPEGTFLHLDAGELDLGVVRDSALNEVNDVMTFAETFENVHMLGVESVTGTVNVCPSGAVMGTRDPAPICASYT